MVQSVFGGGTGPGAAQANQGVFTNAPGTGLDVNGNLMPGWRYTNYVDGKGVGTPINVESATNRFEPGTTGSNLMNLVPQDYAANTNSPWQGMMQQVASRATPNSSFGPSKLTQPGLSQIGSWMPGSNLPGANNNNTIGTNSSIPGLYNLFPRRRAYQGFNRGSRYFSPITGNYTFGT
jgi:hypothetical protein